MLRDGKVHIFYSNFNVSFGGWHTKGMIILAINFIFCLFLLGLLMGQDKSASLRIISARKISLNKSYYTFIGFKETLHFSFKTILIEPNLWQFNLASKLSGYINSCHTKFLNNIHFILFGLFYCLMIIFKTFNTSRSTHCFHKLNIK